MFFQFNFVETLSLLTSLAEKRKNTNLLHGTYKQAFRKYFI